MKTIICALLLLLAAPAQAQPPFSTKLFVATAPAYVTVSFWDAYRTRQCVLAGTCVEKNPLLTPFVKQYGVTKAMVGKSAVQAALLTVLSVYHKKDRRDTALALVALTGLQFAVDVHNEIELRRAHR